MLNTGLHWAACSHSVYARTVSRPRAACGLLALGHEQLLHLQDLLASDLWEGIYLLLGHGHHLLQHSCLIA